MQFLVSFLFFDNDTPSLSPALSQLVRPEPLLLKFPSGHSQYLMYLVLGMLNKTQSDQGKPKFTADLLSFPSSQCYTEFTVCRTVCERRADYQSASNLKVIRILQFSFKPCRKMQCCSGATGGGGGDRLIEE